MEHREVIHRCPGSRWAILLIHGICGSPDHFRDLLPVIPAGWSVYNLLLDGHGAQVRDFARTSMKKWKQQVSRQLDEILVCHEKVLIVGHSMGSLLAIREAVKRKNADLRLFLLNCPLRIQYPPRTMLRSLKVALGKYKASDLQANAMSRCCSIQLTPKLWQYVSWVPRFLELFQQVRMTRKLLPQLTVPCLCFQGNLDELVPLRSCKVIQANLSIRLTVLPESSHYYYAPEDLQLLRTCLLQEAEQMQC